MAPLVTKKKTKKRIVILNMGRRFKGPTWLAQIEEASSEDEDNQKEEVRSTRVEGGNNQIIEDKDYSD